LAIAVALMVALTGGAALTQSDGQVSPAAKQKINVDKVDGKNAISATQNLNKRKGKLMAFNGSGYLPSNIVDGNVATVAALQSPAGAVNEADNPVNWNQIQNVPPAVLAADTTRSFIAGETPLIAVGGVGVLFVDHPVGLEVETTLLPTAVGALVIPGTNAAADVPRIYVRLNATTIREFHIFQVFGVASTVKLRATVWNDSYLSPAAAKGKVKVSFAKNPKKTLRTLGIK